MPGMMDTILNLGLNDQTVEALAAKTGNPRFAWDCYRRFVQMYGDVVLGVQKRPGEDHDPFETVIEGFKHERYHQAVEDTKLTVADLKELVTPVQGADQTARRQAVSGFAVGSADGCRRRRLRLVDERSRDRLSPQVQHPDRMGHRRQRAGDGLRQHRRTSPGLASRSRATPPTATKEFYGEFLINAQGEDVVAGVRTPEPVAELKKQMPKAYAELERIRQTLEKHFKDVQDFEFTIEDGDVYMLQTRNGKRTAMAALKFSMDMYKEKLIDWKTAVMRNPADQLDQLLAPVFDAAEVAK